MKNKPPSWLEEAKRYAFETWEDRFGEPPGWPVKDYVTLSTFLASKKGYISLEDFKARWDKFLTVDKKFYLDNGYGLGFFCSQFNAFVGVRARSKRPERSDKEVEDQVSRVIKSNGSPDTEEERERLRPLVRRLG